MERVRFAGSSAETEPIQSAFLTAGSASATALTGQQKPQRILVVYPPQVEGSEILARDITQHLKRLKVDVDCVSLSGDVKSLVIAEQDMIVALGGDGTMLRCGRIAAAHNVSVLGINLGRLGFLAEVEPNDWKGVLARVLVGDYWVEERMMLRAEHHRGDDLVGCHEILNEAVVSRGALARPIRLQASIGRDEITTYVADGLIISTATGSTAYALAVGGPILPPELKNFLMIPIAPHLCLERAIILAGGASLSIVVRTEHQAILSADGQVEVPLRDGDTICVRTSSLVTRFVRVQEPTYFYRNLTACMSHNRSAEKFK